MAVWEPPLGPKQRELYRSEKRIVLATGPRLCGKTWGLENLVHRHLWRTNPSRFAIICKTTRAGSLGVWPELTGTIFDTWKNAGICSEDAEFGWAKKPTTDPTTKIRHAKLRNRFGGISELLLFPVERSEDAMDKLFSTQFSGIWISEAHLYETRELFDVALNQLRLAGVPTKDTRLYCDCNPPDEGTQHWLYDVFYRERHLPPEKFPEEWDEATKAAFKERQSQMEVFEFELADNTFLDPMLANQVRATYARSPDEFRRFVLGHWIDRGSAKWVFKGVWDRNLHVFGDTSAPDPEDWQVLAPSDGPHVLRESGHPELMTGWDLGESNHGWAAIQPWENEDGRLCFDILDELLYLRERKSVEDVTKEIHKKRMPALVELAGFPVSWSHYSDSSAMLFQSSAIRGDAVPTDDELTDAAIVSAASDGEIELIGSSAVKKATWQRRRVALLCQLLHEKRIRVSAHCTGVIEMFEKLRKDVTDKASTYLAPGQDVKHLFDAVSYPIAMRLIDQLSDTPGPRVVSDRRMISVR